MADDNGHAETLEERTLELEHTNVRVTSYRIGERWAARVDNIDPGDVIGRGRGADRAEAETNALNSAAVRLGMSAARVAIRRGMDKLKALQ